MFLKDYCANLAFISSGIKAWCYPAVCCSVLTGNYWHQRCWGLHWRSLRCSREIVFDLSLLCCLKDPTRSWRSWLWLSPSAVNLSSRAWQIFCQDPLEDACHESFSNFSGQLLWASWNISCVKEDRHSTWKSWCAHPWCGILLPSKSSREWTQCC